MRLVLVLVGNALMRVAASASSVLVALYLADLANNGFPVGATLVGTLGAISFGAELAGSLPLGLASDAIAPRALMTAGALLGALATQLFGMSHAVTIFFLSRTLEGLGAAAVAPPLLAHLTDVTEGSRALRARVMSYFELSLLAGLALGGLMGGQLWRLFHTGAFAAVATAYLVCALLFFLGSTGSRGHGTREAISGLYNALRQPSLQRLAPIWLCVNSIVGLWLGPTLPFLLTQHSRNSQFLAGIYAHDPQRVGWLYLGYSIVFAIGVTAWSFVLPRISLKRALRIGLIAMFAVCLGLLALNHSSPQARFLPWVLGVTTSFCIMIESGFTPAALALLSNTIGAHGGRGAAMGIYSALLSIGAIVGSLLAAALGSKYSVDGLIYGTLVMAAVALALLRYLQTPAMKDSSA